MHYLLNLKRSRLLSLLLAVVLMAGFSTLLTSCGDDDDKAEDKLTGTWVCNDDDYDTHYYVFNKDKSGMYFGLSWADDPDTFTDHKVVNGHLMIKWTGDNDYDDEGAIAVTKDQFTIDYGGDVHVYTKVK